MYFLLLPSLILTVLLAPESAWAWGPATHLHFGMRVLENLNQLPEIVRMILGSHSLVYLYGCVSADIVLAKKLGKAIHHCHLWENGMELLKAASSDRQKAFAYGYLSHLASDCLSHNCYVPTKMVECANSSMLNHIYWEVRFDNEVTNETTFKLFADIVEGDYEDCDVLLESMIPMRIMNFEFNKRVFNRMLMMQGLNRWQRLVGKLKAQSQHDLSRNTVEIFTQRSVAAIMDFLQKQEDASITQVDPKGDHRMILAKRLKRQVLKLSKPSQIQAIQAHRDVLQALPK